MSLSGVALNRVRKELKMLYEEPPPGISAWAREEDSLREIDAVICGAEGTPYAGGHFKLQLSMPQRYPFEPPKVLFVTPIYHPNIDSAGRICLDILNMPPKGAWKPSLNLSTVLSSLQLLMSEPNAEDGLMVDVTHQYINDHARFVRTAAEHTRRHAKSDAPADDGAAASTEASGAAPEAAGAAAPLAEPSQEAAAPAAADTGAESREAAGIDAPGSREKRERGTEVASDQADARRQKTE